LTGLFHRDKQDAAAVAIGKIFDLFLHFWKRLEGDHVRSDALGRHGQGNADGANVCVYVESNSAGLRKATRGVKRSSMPITPL
jgi:hypothetical protein